MTSFPDQPRSATIQVPNPSAYGSKRSIACTFNGMQGKRLALEAVEPVPACTAVSVEYEDALFLGEVVSCVPKDAVWALELKVEQILSGLQSLMALRARLLSEGVPQSLSLIPHGARN